MATRISLIIGICTILYLKGVFLPITPELIIVRSVFADDVNITTPDTDNSYTENGTLITNKSYCYYGTYDAKTCDAYFTFPVPEYVVSVVIDSAKISFYGNKSNETHKIYGILQEDCAPAETGNPHSYNRTTASVTWSGDMSTGWHWTPLLTDLVIEWINTYTHTGTDRLGIVFDDNGTSQESWVADYEYNSSAGNCKLYIWYHQQVSGRAILWTDGQRTPLWSDGMLSAYTDP